MHWLPQVSTSRKGERVHRFSIMEGPPKNLHFADMSENSRQPLCFADIFGISGCFFYSYLYTIQTDSVWPEVHDFNKN